MLGARKTGRGRAIVPEVMAEAYRTAGWAPLTQEDFFRGCIFTGIVHPPPGGIGAVMVASVVWADIDPQYDAYGLGMGFGASLLSGCARLQTGSIIPCLAMHGRMNLLATVQLALVGRFD